MTDMTDGRVRPAAVAGIFYPAEADILERMIDGLLAAAPATDLPPPQAVVAPHAGYIYSGTTAALAFRELAKAGGERVIYLLGPAHYVYVPGVALCRYSAFATPLGRVPVARERVAELLDLGDPYVLWDEAHAPEHSLEVEIPFLQRTLTGFSLVPLLLGEVDPRQVAQDLGRLLRPQDRVVVSSDLSHYHPDQEARRIDRETLETALAEDPDRLLGSEACGRAPWTTLALLGREALWHPRFLGYATSAEASGDTRRVVGYGALSYVEAAS